jgi:hypothetical protein
MSQRLIGAVRLSLAAVAIIALWLVVLPALGQLASVRHRIDGNHAAGINPTAVFYTDHPAMTDIERRIAAKVDAPSAWFWKRSK